MTQQEISFEPPAEAVLPALNAAPRALKQILFNLMSNAIKFTPKGGRISMRIEPSENTLRFAVADTGIGMSEELLARVGQLFVQSDDAYNRRTEGTGLGLALTKTLVEPSPLRVRLQMVLVAMREQVGVAALAPGSRLENAIC